jgi:hypothetical protein
MGCATVVREVQGVTIMVDEGPGFFHVKTSQGELTFESIKDVQRWHAAESQAWKWLIDGATNVGGLMQDLRNQYANWLSSLGQQINQWNGNPNQDSLRQQVHSTILNFLSAPDHILSDHPAAQIATQIVTRFGAASGVGALALLLGKPCSVTFETARGLVCAMLIRDGIDPKSPEIVSKLIGDINSSQDEAKAKRSTEWAALEQQAKDFLASTSTEFRSETEDREKRSSEMVDRVNSAVNGAIKRIEATEATYKEQMKLQAPVAYWSTKAAGHRDALWWSRLRVVIFLIAGSAGLIGLLVALANRASELAAAAPANGSIILLKFSAIAVVATTIAFMVGRMLLRIYLSDRHLLTDAEERIAMIQTYLALSNEGKVSETDRALILAPLFRSAADGIIKDEGMESSIVGLLAKGVERLK